MRTVICHFFNEAYLLPWWLKHHLDLFDHGILIDHGSTDGSADIVRELAPHWALVRSRLPRFDAYLTDFEVMQYEQGIPGWKVALNVTEFLMPSVPLDVITHELTKMGRSGCAASGFLIIDDQPTILPNPDRSLPAQKHWGIDDNIELTPEIRRDLGLPIFVERNRFFHSLEVGMYHPGRHQSFHPDSNFRLLDLMVFHFAYAPWNDDFIRRKTQIASKLKPEDIERQWGIQHLRKVDALQVDYAKIRQSAVNLMSHAYASRAISLAEAGFK